MLPLRTFIPTHALTYIFLACLLLATFTSCSPIAAPLLGKTGILEFLQLSTSDTLNDGSSITKLKWTEAFYSSVAAFPAKRLNLAFQARPPPLRNGSAMRSFPASTNVRPSSPRKVMSASGHLSSILAPRTSKPHAADGQLATSPTTRGCIGPT